MSLYSHMQRYFDHVINAKEFVIAVDPTGVYMFKAHQRSKAIEEHARKLLEILALNEDEAKLIFITSGNSVTYDSFSYEESSVQKFVLEVNRQNIENIVRKLTGVRNVIFTPEDIDSIIDCFQDVTVELTEFQRKLVSLGLTEDQAIKYEVARPDSINDLIELGCPVDLVESVYKEFKEYYVQNNNDFEKLDTNNYVTIEKNMKQYRAGGVTLVVFAVVAWMLCFRFPALKIYLECVSCLIAFIGVNMLSKSMKLKETVPARIGVVVGIVLPCIIIVPTVGVWLVEKVFDLVHGINTAVTTDWFKDLHW